MAPTPPDIRLAMFGYSRACRGPGHGRQPLRLLVVLQTSALILISWLPASVLCQPDQQLISAGPTAAAADELGADDSAFQFTQSVYNATIEENSLGRMFVECEEKMGIYTEDPDVSIKYRIVSGDEENFFKATAEPVGNFVFLVIRTRTSNVNVLNRERVEHYELVVRATFRDSDRQRLRDIRASTTVRVRVVDTNDLDPFFNPSYYAATVAEDQPLHASILRVRAEDADSGINGEIYYSIAEETDQFAVHPVSGILTLTRPLVYSEKTSHRLRVEARDRGLVYSFGPRRVDTASITITVEQVNRHDPELIVHHLPEVIEQSHTDIYAIIRVTDPDPGRHGQVSSLEIIEGDPDAHFRVRAGSEPGEFNIEVLRLLDRELAPSGYNLTLKATDNGIPPRSSYKEVHVRLADLNDHPPVFDKEEYEIRVPESALVNTPLTRLKVTDLDSGRNAKVVLKISAGNLDNQFRIDPVSGMLYVAKPLDAEERSRYTLTVSALDMANAGMRKQSSARVTILVEDVNDNDPLFEAVQKEIWFDENEQAGTRVVRVNARDRDSGDNARISYSIANIDADDLPFEIDHFTGVLKSRKVIDYESDRREYKLIIRASDWGVPFRRQSELKLNIQIRDINDNRPQFEREQCVGKVLRSLPLGGEIITLSALDFDAGNIISYRIVSGNADSCFYLDESTGILSAKCDLGRLPMLRRTLNLTATDGQHFADVMPLEINLLDSDGYQRDLGLNGEKVSFECRTTSVAVRLTELMALAEKNNRPQVEPVSSGPTYMANIHYPTFQRLPKSFYLNETDPVGTEVFKVSAQDQDAGYNGALVYVISSGDADAIFRVNMTTGSVVTMGQPDRERTQDYMLNITACDQGVPHKCSSILSHVVIVDQNDNPPVFMKSAFSFFFPENTRNGTPVVTLNATDRDSGVLGRVTYNLETETEDFALDSKSGLLIVARQLDRESQEFYDLTIRAEDGDPDRPLSAFANVRIRVLDVNDEEPRFTARQYLVKAREDLPVGTVVGFVNAYDPDLYQGGQVTFSIDHGDEGHFQIDRFSGAVRIKKELDYETKQLYNLTVLAVDGGSPSLVAVAAFVVEVLDVNENLHAPRFENIYESAQVPENMPIMSLVTKVVATDFDTGPEDSRVTYSIRGGDGLNSFLIDSAGNVRTAVVLDREAKHQYWLTVYAEDHGAIPLHSKLELFVEVLNVNDNVPLTMQPVYFPAVMENAKPGTQVVTLDAFDADLEPDQQFVYEIVSGDPQSLFAINSLTGQIVTTNRKLDREVQREHELEVRVRDSGQPPLNSTTKVIITVLDENDNAPQFLERFYKIQLPETILAANESPQQDQEAGQLATSEFAKYEQAFENTSWELFAADRMLGKAVFRVIGSDKDEGLNSQLTYSIKNGQPAAGRFQIHPHTGEVYTTASIYASEMFELLVQCRDGGSPALSDVARVSVNVVGPPELLQIEEDYEDENSTSIGITDAADMANSGCTSPPRIAATHAAEVLETDPVGHLVVLLVAESDNTESGYGRPDMIFYDIVSGNEGGEFSISRDKGSLLIAQPLDWELHEAYSLNISVTDLACQLAVAHTQVNIKVVDVNEARPEFSVAEFRVDIPENVSLGGQIAKLSLADPGGRVGSGAQKYFFSIHAVQNLASLEAFRIHPLEGTITLRQKLDHEQLAHHILTVAVKDNGTPSRKNYARLIINVRDNNDHVPQFLSPLIQAKLFETAEIGSAVVQVQAVDMDRGENGRLTYSITLGNIGNTFAIEPDLGTVTVLRQLDMTVQPEYMLMVKATDHGLVPLSATMPVHVLLTMADAAPPRFQHEHYATEVHEDLPRGHFVIHVAARSQSALFYEIVGGNEEAAFQINPSTGIISSRQSLDFERCRFYNLTVEAANNMVAAKARVLVDIHILDVNDNPPRFEHTFFQGNISESASVGSLVLVNNSAPLVVKATDKDSGLNALLLYEILEEHVRQFFTIDSSTGALRTIGNLDYETQAVYDFSVRVSDMGKPRLSAETTARVRIFLQDQNDSPPAFEQQVYDEVLLLPTFTNVTVVRVKAIDMDTGVNASLRYSISGGNEEGIFAIDPQEGTVFVLKAASIGAHTPLFALSLSVTDGKFTDQCKLNLITKKSDNSGLVFSKAKYYATVLENSTKVDVILVLNVLGSALNENLEFRILSPTNMFQLGLTSGALSTTGRAFDREEQENYELIVEVRSEDRTRHTPRIAHVVVEVSVMDLNDNPPMFLNLPYFAIISKEASRDSQVIRVVAVDRDKDANGDIYYQLVRGNGELFRVGRKSGRITLRKPLGGSGGTRDEYTLTVAAYDGGSPPYSSEVQVHVKVVDRTIPSFTEQSYRATVPENWETFDPIMQATALSPALSGNDEGSSVIYYTIESGNEDEIFSLDPRAGVLAVAQPLDYEEKQVHQLTLRATDGQTAGYTEAIVSVLVEDVNDCAPQFLNQSYEVAVSEALPHGARLLQVEARDLDSGRNSQVEYNLLAAESSGSLKSAGSTAAVAGGASSVSDLFGIDPATGTIHLRHSLDYERQVSHLLTVRATDRGTPPLSTDTQVLIRVLDSNDNAPAFEEAEYTIWLSDQARRGQYVGKVRAVDPDISDSSRLTYAIIGGNQHQIFSMDETNGIITLVNLHTFDQVASYLLNVSVSDGVYATSTKVRINLRSANQHSPEFAQPVFEMRLRENLPEDSRLGQLLATDRDRDLLQYSMLSQELGKLFRLDPYTGEVWSRVSLDREAQAAYEIPVMVSDQAGRSSFATIKLSIMDENDNPPAFAMSEYKINIPANLTAGASVVRLTAQDPDMGRYATLTYSIYETKSSGVDDIFAMDSTTGQISLKQSALDLENSVYQFFVRAQDGGRPALHADMPVEIYVMSPLDEAPRFEEHDATHFVEEGSPVGLTVAELSASVSGPEESQVHYRIATTEYSGPDSLFQLDEISGRLIVAKLLDRETKALHRLTILAETDSSPTLNVYTELTVQILDENDHRPEFALPVYEVAVSEAVAAHTAILQVMAADKDFGNNGELTYSLAEASLAHLFSIDPHNGWITTQGQLDYETTPVYNLTVVATDNGKDRRSSSTTVRIALVDANDNPPVFSQRLYSAAVNEGALPGTIIFQLQTTDADMAVESHVEFAITGGDPGGHFQIKQNGEMYVARSLDRETMAQYRMEVSATDGMFVSTCRVTIEILDDNDSPPVCSHYSYRHEVVESVVPGTELLSITATDADEGRNARQAFSISGATADLFSVDQDTGVLSTALPLDREKLDRHRIHVWVQDADMPEWSCQSHVEIVLTDANDNNPEWEAAEAGFEAALLEDAAIGSIVTKVYATDRDLRENRRITYSLLDSADGHFEIDPRRGLVSLAKALDREERDTYNLTVRAMDAGRPRGTALTSLLIRVLDVNDNPPEFTSKYYFATVAEGVPLGTDVVRLLATSRDIGVNAEITYAIVGGNEHRTFAIDPHSGLVSVAAAIDYERSRAFFLTIQARDGGTVPLTNRATVNITVMDMNDNAPVFSQVSYSTAVSESSEVGVGILTLTASDLDQGENGRIQYGVVHGDRQGQFHVDPDTGVISIAQNLDREMISSYVLEVQARDHGSPQLSTSVLVNILIEDANDNPPLFPEGNYTVWVQEDKPYGHILLTFSVTDADDTPNGVPFSWDIRAGNEDGAFRVVQDGSLRTAKKFNHKLRNQYSLQIRVFDNGTPPLFSDTYVTVNIIEESQYPPVISPLDIEIFSYQDDFPGAVIGRVRASDQDPYDVLGYELLPSGLHLPHALHLFEMDRRDGTLVALQGLDVGTYSLNVSVSDGKFISFESARVSVNLVTDDLLEKAVVVQFAKVSPEEFLISYRKSFVKVVKALFNVRSKDVEILGLQVPFNGLSDGDVRAPRSADRGEEDDDDNDNDDGEDIEAGPVQNKKAKSKKHVVVGEVAAELLLAVRRDNALYFTRAEVRQVLTAKLASMTAQTGLKILGVAGDDCEQAACKNGRCRDLLLMSESHVVSVTTDVDSLVFPRFHRRTVCECRVGFSGEHCETIANECHREPCPSYKVCVPDSSPDGFSCQCPPGLTGAICSVNITTCQHRKCSVVNPIQLSGRSYAQYTLKRSVERHLSLSLGFRTMYSVATLMYAQGLVDYSILEIVDGRIQYRFNFGSGEGLVRLNEKVVNDGEWQEVKLERHGNSAEIAVNGKWRVHGAAPGLNDVLNLEQSDVYFGAEVVATAANSSSAAAAGAVAVSRGFVGCLDDIQVDHVSLPLHIQGDSSVARLRRFANIEFKCGELAAPGPCGHHPCQHGGTCLEMSAAPGGYACTCGARFSGASCEYDLDPCASGPCLHGAKCVNLKNDYHCECPVKLSGKRCHYGRYCNPNPCQNGGLCEEGISGPICKCRGYTGELCTIDVNECLHQNPCHNGGTCVNSPGGFHCICPGNSTGVYCSESAHVSLVSQHHALSLEEVVGIILSLFIIVLIVAAFVYGRRFTAKRRRQHRPGGGGGAMNVIQNQFDLTGRGKKKQQQQMRNNNGVQKLNNYELREQQELLLTHHQQRPASVSPSLPEDETHFNYPDTVHNYGPAADELEATLPHPHHRLPHDFIQNIQKPVATVAPSMMADRDMNLKDNYFLRKKSSPGRDGASSTRPSSSSSLLYRPVKLRVNLPPAVGGDEDTCHSELSVEEDCQRYHWDCSDWAHTATASPALFELPNGAVMDSPSWVSEAAAVTRAGGSATGLAAAAASRRPLAYGSSLAPLEHLLVGNSGGGPVDPTRDFETLPEDEEDNGQERRRPSLEEDEGDSSECESQLGAVYPDESTMTLTSPMHQTDKSIEELMMINGVNYADDDEEEEGGSHNIPNSYDYHINHYLPTYHLGSDPDTQDEATPMLGRHPFAAGRVMAAVSPPIRSPDGLMPKYGFYHHSPPLATTGALPGVRPLLPLGGQPQHAASVGDAVYLTARPAAASSEDQLCELEDSGDELDKSAAAEAAQRVAASPRVTQV